MYANNLFNLFNDGRPAQIQAVLAYISAQDGLENSWSEHRYRAEPSVGHWDSCRSTGYVITLKSFDYRQQLNVVVTTHPVGDQILIGHWEGTTVNAPTWHDIPEDHTIKTEGVKMGFNTEFSYDDAQSAAEFIVELLEKFWDKTNDVCTFCGHESARCKSADRADDCMTARGLEYKGEQH